MFPDLRFESLRFFNTHTPPGCGTSNNINQGHVFSQCHFDQLQNELFDVTLIFCDLQGNSLDWKRSLTVFHQLENINSFHTIPNKAYAAWHIITDTLQEDFKHLVREARIAHMKTRYEAKVWIHLRLHYLRNYVAINKQINHEVHTDDLFTTFVQEFIHCHAQSPGQDVYQMKLHEWAKTFDAIERGKNVDNVDEEVRDACLNFDNARTKRRNQSQGR